MKRTRRRRLGQHFLTNPKLTEKIVRLADVTVQDVVLEIGPGRGILTEPLLQACKQLIVVETDKKLAAEIQERFADEKKLKLYVQDILQFDIEKELAPYRKKKIKVVANLPYAIATEIIFRLIDHRDLFSELYVMVQREVADRLVAKPGRKDYGVLSIMTQIFCESRIIMKVPPGSFQPPPKVDSAVVAMKLSEKPRVPIEDIEKFRKLVRQAFATRRKMLKNALQSIMLPVGVTWNDVFAELGIAPKVRAEELSIEKFAALVRHVA